MSNYIDSDCFRSGTHMNSGWQGLKENKDSQYNIKYYCSKNDSMLGYGYVKAEDILKNKDVVGEYKVAFQSSSPLDNKVVRSVFVMEPESCCSRTYIVLHDRNKLNAKESCDNVLKYMKTKFARAMIKTVKNTQNASAQAYLFVPMQDFTSNSDIDWTKPIHDLDEQFYKKYNLSDYEKAYIESTIAPVS